MFKKIKILFKRFTMFHSLKQYNFIYKKGNCVYLFFIIMLCLTNTKSSFFFFFNSFHYLYAICENSHIVWYSLHIIHPLDNISWKMKITTLHYKDASSISFSNKILNPIYLLQLLIKNFKIVTELAFQITNKIHISTYL